MIICWLQPVSHWFVCCFPSWGQLREKVINSDYETLFSLLIVIYKAELLTILVTEKRHHGEIAGQRVNTVNDQFYWPHRGVPRTFKSSYVEFSLYYGILEVWEQYFADYNCQKNYKIWWTFKLPIIYLTT